MSMMLYCAGCRKYLCSRKLTSFVCFLSLFHVSNWLCLQLLVIGSRQFWSCASFYFLVLGLRFSFSLV